MIQAAIQEITNLVKAERPRPDLAVNDGTGRTWLWSETLKEYRPLPQIPGMKVEASTLDSFADIVFSLCKLPGTTPIATINDTGGDFKPFGGMPDATGRFYTITYRRSYTQGWNLLRKNLGVQLEQVPFVRLIQGLRPFFTDKTEYSNVLASFRRVTFNENNQVTSNPFLEEGKAKRQITLEVSVKGGPGQQAYLPAGFKLLIPVSSGRMFEVELEIDAILRVDRKIVFSLFSADAARIEEEVRDGEVRFLKETASTTEGAEQLLVIRND